jgi:hypothetical protein
MNMAAADIDLVADMHLDMFPHMAAEHIEGRGHIRSCHQVPAIGRQHLAAAVLVGEGRAGSTLP